MKIIKETSLTQQIGFALIVISLISGVVAVFQELASRVYYSNEGSLSNQVILQPLQLNEYLPTQPEQGKPGVPVDKKTTPTPVVQETRVPDQQSESLIPETIVISSIHLLAPIIPVHFKDVIIDGQDFIEWQVLDERAAGWHDTSARLGELGNLILNGHHNTFGMVFSKLVDLKKGDLIIITSGSSEYLYEVDRVLILREEGLSNETRIQNASWIAPTPDERLTLVTCWPPGDNTHRVIVVAYPAGD